MSVAPIEVVLPTYNGVLYLEDQIASIYHQTLRPERVLLRDDGSSDGTQAVIIELQEYYGKWLKVLPADGNLGCVANVNRLLVATTAPYVALADQDDLWMPEKLERSLDLMKQLEACYGTSTPLLVHSDLELVDKDGASLGFSYLNRQRINPLRTAPEDLVLTNVVTGCTVLVNLALLEKALPIPTKALMHDWWLALVASVFGRIDLLSRPTVQYRQHEANLLGAQGLGNRYWRSKLGLYLLSSKKESVFFEVVEQASYFERRYGVVISRLPSILTLPRRSRLRKLLRLGQMKHGFQRSFFTLLLCLFLPRRAH